MCVCVYAYTWNLTSRYPVNTPEGGGIPDAMNAIVCVYMPSVCVCVHVRVRDAHLYAGAEIVAESP